LPYFVIGLVAGGAVAGWIVAIAAGFVPALATPVTRALLLTALVLAVSRDLGVISLGLPQNGRQVTPRVAARDPLLGALQFGFEMGTGMRTFITASAPYVLVVGALLAASTLDAVIAGIGFGFGRAIMAGSSLAAGADTWLAAMRRRQRAFTVLCCLATGAAIIAVL
jgi:hypothetical protein